MPAFGPIGAYASSDESTPGSRCSSSNDDRKGLAWMIVLHQGSGSPRRGTVRFHSLETWLFTRKGRRLAAHTRTMADFGDAIPNCPGAPLERSMRLLPDPACKSVYEEWDTALDVGGALRARPGFAIDNAIAQFDPAGPIGSSSTRASPAARTTRPAGTPTARATSAPSSIRAGSCATAAGRASAPMPRPRGPPRASSRSSRAACASTSPTSAAEPRTPSSWSARATAASTAPAAGSTRATSSPGYCVIRAN